MMFKMTEREYVPDPVLEQALDILFILHADHEQNCSANAMRSVGSSHPDPYVAAAAAAGGPLRAPARRRQRAGVADAPRDRQRVDNRCLDYVKRVKAGEFRLMGFGHRVYKNYDPRAQRSCGSWRPQVFEVTGRNPLLDIAARAGEASPWRTTSSWGESSTPMSTSIRGSSIRRWASRWRCSRCCSPSRARSVGSPSGRRYPGK